MSETRHCAACGAPLPAQAANDAACPACLVRLALRVGPEEQGAAPGPGTPAGGADRPSRVGPYEIVGVLGEGGMGTVYLAEQREPLRRRIALKIIKRGMDSAAVLRRFEGERQALALMNHPTIARVFEAGESAGGQPFFAMEYVEGESITEFCDRRQMTTRERLDLFARVCDGIQHAHQKGVIHRDIKPSNVLVAEEEGKPAPKIIDFGIAKAMGHSLTERTLVTDLGVLVGTPEYMSPEQTDPMGLDVDTRTDVYSLGVLLYRLLTGALPFEAADRTEPGLEGLRRRIREETPSRPSARLATLGDAAAEGARLRRVDVAALRRQLAGDLDWITMKALEKDRGRRYGSPADLAADVRRHLGSEPVMARPPSAVYQLRRFARRNRTLVGGIAATFIVLIGGVIVSTALGLREAQQRKAAERARDDLAEVVKFQVEMLTKVDPEEAGRRLFAQLRDRVTEAERRRGASTSRIQSASSALEQALRGVNATDLARWELEANVLAPAAKAIESGFADRPLIEARLRENLGATFRRFSLYDAAETQLVRAVELIERERGRGHPETLHVLNNLALLHRARGQSQEAERLYREIIEAGRLSLSEEHPYTLESKSNLGWVLDNTGKYDEAENLLREVVEKRRRVLGEDHYDTLVSMTRLSFVLLHRGRYEEAERLQLETLERKRRVIGEDDPQTLQAMISLAGTYQELGRYQDAERFDLQALAGLRRVYGDEHPETLAEMNDLGYLYQAMGRFEDARRLHAAALEVAERVVGKDHHSTLEMRADLAAAYDGLGRYKEAEPLHRQAVEGALRALGEDHSHTLGAMDGLASSYLSQRRYDEAEPLLLRTLDGRKRTLGADAQDTLLSMDSLVTLYIARKRYEEAEPLCVEVVETRRRLHGETNPSTLDSKANLAMLYSRQGRFEEAEPIYREVLTEIRRVRGDDHPQTLAVMNGYAWLLASKPVDRRDPQQALQLALRANEGSGFKDPTYLDTLALAYRRTGDRPKAIEIQKKAIAAVPSNDKHLRAELSEHLAALEAGDR